MLLLQSWKESFTMLKPKNIKLLGLVTLKSFAQAYGILLYSFWWLLVLVIVIEASCYYPECLFAGAWSYYIIKVLKLLLIALMCAIARPSITRKNRSYMMSYSFRCLLTAYLLLSLPMALSLTFGMILLFATFFYLDSYGSLQDTIFSIVRGCRMFFYNLPVCGVSLGIAFVMYNVMLRLLGVYSTYLFLLAMPFVLAWVKNIYVKRLHDQFSVYYRV